MDNSRADRHDRDKLARWHQDLADEGDNPFPVFGLFLVTSEDQDAHGVFRQFRASFEARGAEFEHLVILGQHGVSSTVEGLLSRLGLSRTALPLLALFPGPSAEELHTLPLTGGPAPDRSERDTTAAAGPGTGEPWRDVLSGLENAVDGGKTALDPACLPGVTGLGLSNGPFVELVGQVLEQVS